MVYMSGLKVSIRAKKLSIMSGISDWASMMSEG